eukprot:TRINITY_DN65647_c6_g1_i2.p1 TRINITY_DN65647_c6_g1~~TRINITY_DN65647_c6_g1_i2.p1  ORF type:complete len:1077 (-),score=268.43 TRINITY_DN65647_c6_g1_i2:80-2902(-)
MNGRELGRRRLRIGWAQKNTTLYIGDLDGKVTTEELRALFSKYGELVVDESYVRPPRNMFGFVRFRRRQDAEIAKTELNGHSINGRIIRVGWGDNKVEKTCIHIQFDPANAPGVDEYVLQQTFSRFGSIASVAMPRMQRVGAPKGYAFVHFESGSFGESAASDAIEAMNDTDLVPGVHIKCSFGKKHGPSHQNRYSYGGGGRGRGGSNYSGRNRYGPRHYHNAHHNSGYMSQSYGGAGNGKGRMFSPHMGQYHHQHHHQQQQYASQQHRHNSRRHHQQHQQQQQQQQAQAQSPSTRQHPPTLATSRRAKPKPPRMSISTICPPVSTPPPAPSGGPAPPPPISAGTGRASLSPPRYSTQMEWGTPDITVAQGKDKGFEVVSVGRATIKLGKEEHGIADVESDNKSDKVPQQEKDADDIKREETAPVCSPTPPPDENADPNDNSLETFTESLKSGLRDSPRSQLRAVPKPPDWDLDIALKRVAAPPSNAPKGNNPRRFIDMSKNGLKGGTRRKKGATPPGPQKKKIPRKNLEALLSDMEELKTTNLALIGERKRHVYTHLHSHRNLKAVVRTPTPPSSSDDESSTPSEVESTTSASKASPATPVTGRSIKSQGFIEDETTDPKPTVDDSVEFKPFLPAYQSLMSSDFSDNPLENQDDGKTVLTYRRQCKRTDISLPVLQRQAMQAKLSPQVQFRDFQNELRLEKLDFNRRVHSELERIHGIGGDVFAFKHTQLMGADVKQPLELNVQKMKKTINAHFRKQVRDQHNKSNYLWFTQYSSKILGMVDTPEIKGLLDSLSGYFVDGRLTPKHFEAHVKGIPVKSLFNDDTQFVLEHICHAFGVTVDTFKELLKKRFVHYRIEQAGKEKTSTQLAAPTNPLRRSMSKRKSRRGSFGGVPPIVVADIRALLATPTLTADSRSSSVQFEQPQTSLLFLQSTSSPTVGM